MSTKYKYDERKEIEAMGGPGWSKDPDPMDRKANSTLVTFLYLLGRNCITPDLVTSLIGNARKDGDHFLGTPELASLAERWARELGVEPQPEAIGRKATDESDLPGFQPGDFVNVKQGESPEQAVDRTVKSKIDDLEFAQRIVRKIASGWLEDIPTNDLGRLSRAIIEMNSEAITQHNIRLHKNEQLINQRKEIKRLYDETDEQCHDKEQAEKEVGRLKAKQARSEYLDELVRHGDVDALTEEIEKAFAGRKPPEFQPDPEKPTALESRQVAEILRLSDENDSLKAKLVKPFDGQEDISVRPNHWIGFGFPDEMSENEIYLARAVLKAASIVLDERGKENYDKAIASAGEAIAAPPREIPEGTECPTCQEIAPKHRLLCPHKPEPDSHAAREAKAIENQKNPLVTQELEAADPDDPPRKPGACHHCGNMPPKHHKACPDHTEPLPDGFKVNIETVCARCEQVHEPGKCPLEPAEQEAEPIELPDWLRVGAVVFVRHGTKTRGGGGEYRSGYQDVSHFDGPWVYFKREALSVHFSDIRLEDQTLPDEAKIPDVK